MTSNKHNFGKRSKDNGNRNQQYVGIIGECVIKDMFGLKYIDGLKYEFVKNIESADFILGCTTSPGLRTFDYVPLLEKAI